MIAIVREKINECDILSGIEPLSAIKTAMKILLIGFFFVVVVVLAHQPHA